MNEQREPAFWPWLITLGGSFGGVIYFLTQDDKMTAAALTTVIVSALIGYGLKASRLLSLLFGLSVASLVAPLLAPFCESTLAAWLVTSDFTRRLLSFAVPGLAIAAVVSFALRRLLVKCRSEQPWVSTFDRVSGFVIGAVQGAALSLLVIAGLLVLDPLARQRQQADTQLRDHKMARVWAEKIVNYAALTRESAIGPLVAEYNPFDYLQPLKEFRHELDALTETVSRQPSKSELAVEAHYSAR